MRFWITKNSDVPVREQLIRQVILGILSDDLPAGSKLPSIRAMARQHRIHSNTVSGAFHDLLERGWVELRRGSGLYVRPLTNTSTGRPSLDAVISAAIQHAAAQGYRPEELLQRFETLVRPRRYKTVLVADEEPAMRRILVAELRETIDLPVEAVATEDLHTANGDALVVMLPRSVESVRDRLAHGVNCVPLKLRSVGKALQGRKRPGRETMIAVASESAAFRRAAHAVLMAVGIDPEAFCEVDASTADWPRRLASGVFVIADVITAKRLDAAPSDVFRVIADGSILQLKEIAGNGPVAHGKLPQS